MCSVCLLDLKARIPAGRIPCLVSPLNLPDASRAVDKRAELTRTGRLVVSCRAGGVEREGRAIEHVADVFCPRAIPLLEDRLSGKWDCSNRASQLGVTFGNSRLKRSPW